MLLLSCVFLSSSCRKVNFCKTPAVGFSRLESDGRACQQVAKHWGQDLKGEFTLHPASTRLDPLFNQILPIYLPGETCFTSDNSQQPAADDVPGPSALVLHISNLFLHEPTENTASAPPSSSPQLRGTPCPGVWALGLQWQASGLAGWKKRHITLST